MANTNLRINKKRQIEQEKKITLKMFDKDKLIAAYHEKGMYVLDYETGKLPIPLEMHTVNYGDRLYMKCPLCQSRRDKLYIEIFKGNAGRQPGAICRECMKLNYESQQRTKSDEYYHFYKMYEIALKLKQSDLPDRNLMLHYPAPARPKNMHTKTYDKHIAEYYKHREIARSIQRERENKHLKKLHKLLKR